MSLGLFLPHNCFSGSHAGINDSRVTSWVRSQTFDLNTPYVFETIPGKKAEYGVLYVRAQWVESSEISSMSVVSGITQMI